MCLEPRYQFRASRFLPGFTHCFHRTNSWAQQDLYRVTALLEGECATAAHHKHFISIPAPSWSAQQRMTSSRAALAFFCCRDAESLRMQQKCKIPRDTALPAGFSPWPWHRKGESSGRCREGQPKSAKGSCGEHTGEDTNCKREEFNGIPRSFSACTWPSASL